MYVLTTDGARKGKTTSSGVGGWAYVLRTEAGQVLAASGAEPGASSNCMEMLAAIRGLQYLSETYGSCEVLLVSDSEYLINGLESWLDDWIRRGWRTSIGKPVKNRDAWQQLYNLKAFHRLTTIWVRGHQGHPDNERADTLASEAAEYVYSRMLLCD